MEKIIAFARKFFGIWFSIAGTGMFILYALKQFTLSPGQLHTAFFIAGAVAGILALLWQYRISNQQLNRQLQELTELITGFSLAYFFCFYATGKLFELQFVVFPDTLARPAGELGGFEKAWLFFAHAPSYNYFIAAGQLFAALLLLFRRTRTAGAFIYFFIMVNITVIDFAYGITAMQEMAVLLLCMSAFLLLCSGKQVWAFLFSQRQSALATPGKTMRWPTAIAMLLFVAGIINDILFFSHASIIR